MVKSTPFGRLLRDHRHATGHSLRRLGELISDEGLSHVFLGEVERGLRRLPRKYWPRVSQLLGVPIATLERADLRSRPVTIEIASQSTIVQDLVLRLASAIDAGALSNPLARDLDDILVGQVG